MNLVSSEAMTGCSGDLNVEIPLEVNAVPSQIQTVCQVTATGGSAILLGCRWKGKGMISIEDARQFYTGADSVHDFAHVLRVLNLAERLSEAEGADRRVVRTAALLHDISRLDDDDLSLEAAAETDHAVLAARLVRRVLVGENPAFVDAVAHCIEAHRFRNDVEPETIEAKVLFDADKLDAIGAVGVARAFAYSGHLGQPLWGEVSPDYVPGTIDEPHTAHHEFHVKLKHIQDRLYTDSGRRLAAERHRFMTLFFAQMAAEIRGER